MRYLVNSVRDRIPSRPNRIRPLRRRLRSENHAFENLATRFCTECAESSDGIFESVVACEEWFVQKDNVTNSYLLYKPFFTGRGFGPLRDDTAGRVYPTRPAGD